MVSAPGKPVAAICSGRVARAVMIGRPFRRTLPAAILVAAATGCGARTGVTADVIEAGRVDDASGAGLPESGLGAPGDAGVECAASEPVVGSLCPVNGYQCFYFPPGDPRDIDVFYCQGGVWAGSSSEVDVPECGDVACIEVPAQCIMGSCQRCTCGADGFYDDCGPC